MSSNTSLVSIVTAVLWLVWSAAGIAGLLLQYQHPAPPTKDPAPVTAEKLDVQMVSAPVSVQPEILQPPPLTAAAAAAPDQPPAIMPVAAPSPAIPFAEPVTLPVTIAQKTVPIRHLIFGVGEGDKPPPEYPREAKIARQQGIVVVRFTVDESGHVTDAEAASSSPYPLLNQAAVRAVRDTWDFPSGRVRVYDVTFQFELH